MTDRRGGFPTELMGHLSDALKAVEGARRASDPADDMQEALDDVMAFRRALEDVDPDRVPPSLGGLLESAEGDLRSGALEDARESLLEVGRAIDAFLKGA